MKFSNIDRNSHISSLKNLSFDLIIIGGGITGAGILLDAASRGMRALLLEKGDFASGTSSKSTKLIHGGLRYLKQFDFWLVKEVGSERAIVHKMAPHLVIPEKMLLPLVEQGSYGKWLTSIGLKVYDMLAQVEGEDQRKMLDTAEALALEPLLPPEIVKGAGYYAEYRTDDARLTLEAIKTGREFGGEALNYAEVTEFLYQDERVCGVRVTDKINDQLFDLYGSVIVNASGPWVDDLRGVNKSKTGKQLHLTKGAHLVFPRHKLPVKQAVYFDVPDGRMIFAIPRGQVTYVGTTDTNYNGNKEEVYADLTDALYLTSAVNHMFPGLNLELEDIVSSWAGLRPLIHEEGKSPSELSRKDEIFNSPSGLISIAGGKLTGYRKMAERVTDKVAEILEANQSATYKPCQTDHIPLCGGPWEGGFDEVIRYIDQLHGRIRPLGYNIWHARYLTHLYGKQAELILEILNNTEGKDAEEALLLAELEFAINHEAVVYLEDFFIRRTGRMYFEIESVSRYAEAAAHAYCRVLHKDPALVKDLVSELKHLVSRHSDFSFGRV